MTSFWWLSNWWVDKIHIQIMTLTNVKEKEINYDCGKLLICNKKKEKKAYLHRNQDFSDNI